MAKTKADWQAEALALRADIEIIADRLREEAINHAWCEEYGDVMTEINSTTSEEHMLQCTTDKKVNVCGEVTVKFSDMDLMVSTGGGDPESEEVEAAVLAYLCDVVGLSGTMHYVIDDVDSVVITEQAVN